MLKGRVKKQAGFTLIELLIVILIVGILAAVAVPLYFGYIKDARTAEGKALAGSGLTALQACRQGSDTSNCNLTTLAAKIGLNGTNFASGGVWEMTALANALNFNPTTANWEGATTNVVRVNGTGVAKNLVVMIDLASGVFQAKCSQTNGTDPADC